MKLFGTPRPRWEENFKVYAKEIGCENEECIAGHKAKLSLYLIVMS
jgi:hypothetical protein